MQKSIVYVHEGILPSYLVDSVFQLLLINTDISVNVIINSSQVGAFKEQLQQIDFELYSIHPTINIIAIEGLHVEEYNIPKSLETFRDNFWKLTTSRFFVIEAFMKAYDKSLVFHIENDVMMYKSLSSIYSSNCTSNDNIWVVKDSPNRVVPSIVFFPNLKSIQLLTKHIKSASDSSVFKNDMDILGNYKNVHKLPYSHSNKASMIFDGAAIGQFLGGIDPRNTGRTLEPKDSLYTYRKTRGFVNETSVFKANTCKYITKKVLSNTGNNINVFLALKDAYPIPIANLHVHSKNLAMFSSINTLNFYDIISGDRVLHLCDLVFTTPQIYNFHIKSRIPVDKFVIVKNFNDVDVTELQKIIKSINKSQIKIFVYTHILSDFQNGVLCYFPSDVSCTIYTGNSDHCFDKTYLTLVQDSKIAHVYAQNLNIISDKCTLLPIGIANAMWIHGDIKSVYMSMLQNYCKYKENGMYVNINPATFPYRKVVLEECLKNGFKQSKSKPYPEYLKELATYRFCLCIRGNGLDTHRFWESLYMGVIPVVINNVCTNSVEFTMNLLNLGIPFIEIKDLTELTPSNFTYERYKKFINDHGSSVYNSIGLRLSDFD
jgi:hypothetical protein